MDSKQQIYGLTILHPCGGGAFGEVFQCRDASGKELALKIVSKTKVGSEWERELKGITLYRKLAEDAPELLKLYHVGEDEHAFYYTMELADAVPGQVPYQADTLATRLQKGALPQEQLIPTLSAILKGLQTLHEAGFAHRDIKPENILFLHGSPKLADLGLLSPLTGTMTQLAGTLDFLPPEERTGDSPNDSRESCRRNDLYAFGKLIYCCVSGNSAKDYPSLPREMPLTTINRLFFRLARRLCDQEPTRRLNTLPELLMEFQRTVHLCQFGETFPDKLRYAFSSTHRNLRSLAIRTARLCRRHWCLAVLFLCALLAGGVWLWHEIASRPDRESEELAQTLQQQKKEAQKTPFNKTDFTFFHGRYSVAIPADWELFDHDAIAHAYSIETALTKCLYGLLTPKVQNGNANTSIALMILPVTASDLFSRNQQGKIQLLKGLFSENVEAIALRQYKNPRLNLEMIHFMGMIPPSKSFVCYLFPQSDHTLCLAGIFPDKRFETDMGIFLRILDSLTWRSSPADAKKE